MDNPVTQKQPLKQRCKVLRRHSARTDILPPHGDAPNFMDRLPAEKPKAPLAKKLTGTITTEKLQAQLSNILTDNKEKKFTDPTGNKVKITMALANHIAEDTSRRLSGRERFFPLIPELIEDPAEIWTSPAKNSPIGKVTLRRRYVKLVKTEKARTLILVAYQDNKIWSALTLFVDKGRATNVRKGELIYRKK